jgi:hypothetical protein
MLKRLLRPLVRGYRDFMLAGLSGQLELLRQEQTRFFEEQARLTRSIETALLTIALHEDEARQDHHYTKGH